jgi:hypothetical protein
LSPQVGDLGLANWGPGDHSAGQANATIFNVDAADNPCMDVYTSGAFKVADMYGIVPMMFLHCNPAANGAGGHTNTSCTHEALHKKCEGGFENLTCAMAMRLHPAGSAGGVGCAHFGCDSADGKCNTNGDCDTPSGVICYSPPQPPSPPSPATYPRPCNINPENGAPDASDGPLEAHFAVSRTGSSFTRLSRRPFIPRGQGKPRIDPRTPEKYWGVWDGDFDSASTTIAVGYYELGDEVVMMEAGWQYTHGGIDYGVSPSTAPNHHPGILSGGPVLSGLQLLTLRKHGYVSLSTRDSASEPGKFTTKLLQLPNCRGSTPKLALSLNYESSIDGYVAVTMRLSPGNDSPGNLRAAGIPLIGNEVAGIVSWQAANATNPSVRALPSEFVGGSAAMDVELWQADLYAFAFKCVWDSPPVKTDDTQDDATKLHAKTGCACADKSLCQPLSPQPAPRDELLAFPGHPLYGTNGSEWRWYDSWLRIGLASILWGARHRYFL